MQLPGAKTPVSPKVLSGANWSTYATLLLTILGFITPDMLTGLGHFAPLVYGLVVAATYAIGSYLKADPARDAGLSAQSDIRDQVQKLFTEALATMETVHTVVVNNPAPAPPADVPAPAETTAAPAAPTN